MEIKKTDENYIYNIIGKNVKKYRKQKGLTQSQLAEKINYSLSFVSSLESRKYQSFSLGALYRIALILEIDMYKLCIDDTIKEPLFVKYKCNKCDYETDIPYEIIKIIMDAKNLNSNKTEYITFNCKNCEGKIQPTKTTKKDNIEQPV